MSAATQPDPNAGSAIPVTPPPAASPASNVKTEETTFRGRRYTKETTTEEVGKLGRVGALVTGVAAAVVGGLGTVLTLGKGLSGIVMKDEITKSFGTVFSGTYEKDPVYTENTATITRCSSDKTGGYNPTDTDSMLNYVDANKHKLLTANGHQYIINYADSAIIMIPNGERANICEITFWDRSTGEDIGDEERLEKSVRAYLAGHNKIEKAANGLPFTQIVISFQSKTIRSFNNLLPEQDISIFKGNRIELDEDTWKTMLNFFNNEKTDRKQSVKGEKVHKHEDDNPLSSLLNNKRPPSAPKGSAPIGPPPLPPGGPPPLRGSKDPNWHPLTGGPDDLEHKGKEKKTPSTEEKVINRTVTESGLVVEELETDT